MLRVPLSTLMKQTGLSKNIERTYLNAKLLHEQETQAKHVPYLFLERRKNTLIFVKH